MLQHDCSVGDNSVDDSHVVDHALISIIVSVVGPHQF
jgi:hypothetical protein